MKIIVLKMVSKSTGKEYLFAEKESLHFVKVIDLPLLHNLLSVEQLKKDYYTDLSNHKNNLSDFNVTVDEAEV